MDEIVELTQQAAQPAVPEISIEQMEAQIRQAQSGENPQVQPVAPAVHATQGTPAEQEQPQGQVMDNKIEPKSDAPTFADLQAKQGFKDPNALAKSYVELRKELEKKFQEAAELRRQAVSSEPIATPPIQPPAQSGQADMDGIFAQRVAQVGVVQAMAEMMKAVTKNELKPFNEQNAETSLRNKVAELETAPATASTFANPAVQEEIRKVISENPSYYYKDLSVTLPEAYERALGRIALRGAAGKPASAQSAATFFEGKAKPIMPQPLDKNTAPLDEMEKQIRQLMG